MEVLSPVKNLEIAKAVIQAGSDAIYLGSPNFGARKKAAITMDEVKAIINYATLRNIKTYIAFNTIIFQHEIKNFFNEIDHIYQIGATGIILQDMSFIKVLKDHYPDLEIHCSTQMNINNLAATKLVKALGANRIVAPREMAYNNIKYIKDNIDIEIEVFVHGALCVAYSGLCFNSTLLDQKSANRGNCSQFCRMSRRLVNLDDNTEISKGEYPLSLKDLNNIDHLDSYKKAAVDSIKIEGRLKDVTYAAFLTENYKNKVLDKNFKAHDLKRVFNREHTTGRISGVNGLQLVNQNRINNYGFYVGEVKDVILNNDKKNGFYKYLIKIDGEINHLDNIRFIGNKTELGMQVDSLNTQGLIYANIEPSIGDLVYKTRDAKLASRYKNYANLEQIKRDINISLVITDQVFYTINNIDFTSFIQVQTPIKTATLSNDIINKLNRTKDTPFNINLDYMYYEEDKFISMKDLTKLKNEIIDNYLTSLSIVRVSNMVNLNLKPLKVAKNINYFIEVNTKQQYEIFKNSQNTTIIIGNLKLLDEIKISQADYILLPSVIYDHEQTYINQLFNNCNNFMVSELGAIHNLANKNLISNFTFNTTNKNNQHELIKLGVEKNLISCELNKQQLTDFANLHSIVNIYGKIPVMVMDYCPINLAKKDDCGKCSLCQRNNYALVDELERKFSLKYAGFNRINLYDHKPINLLKNMVELNALGFSNFHLRLVDEDLKTLKEIKNFIDDEVFDLNDNYFGNYDKYVK